MPEFKRLLCPVDFSPSAEKALRYAENLGKHFGSEILLVHAFEDPAYIMPMTGYLGPEPGLINQLRKRYGFRGTPIRIFVKEKQGRNKRKTT